LRGTKACINKVTALVSATLLRPGINLKFDRFSVVFGWICEQSYRQASDKLMLSMKFLN
jgi:hypothetical protein